MDHDNRESWLTCGYTVRIARKWLEKAGAPVCPTERHGAMRHNPLDATRVPDEDHD